jgi:ABC-type nitrate/sulfonate/bicarbonate transport system substrate-binding protein
MTKCGTRTINRRGFIAGGVGVLGGGALAHSRFVPTAVAQSPTNVKVIVFPGLANLSIFAAQHKGLFAKHGLAIELINTPNSGVLRNGLAKGDHHIAHAGVDNAVAMAELAKADIAIIMGGDNGFNRIIVQPDVKSYADLRGKTVVVDAPNTAYALVLYKVLKENGLNKGDYVVKPVGAGTARLEAMTKDKTNAAAVLYPPFSIHAAQAGFKDMGAAAKALGAYQADGAFVMRDWAKANSDTVVHYIKAYVEGRRWVLDPANILCGRGRSERRSRKGCEVRYGGIQERAKAARRDRRAVGRQPACARQIPRPVILRQGAGGVVILRTSL